MRINNNFKNSQNITNEDLEQKKVERQKEKNNRKKKLSQALRSNLARRKSSS